MPIERSVSPDFNSPQFCRFLCDVGSDGSVSDIDDRVRDRATEGFEFDQDWRSLGVSEALNMPVYFEHLCEVRSIIKPNRLLLNRVITDFAVAQLVMDCSAVLFTKQGLDSAKKAHLVNAFNSVDFGVAGQVEQAEKDYEGIGGSSDDYQIDIVSTFQRSTANQVVTSARDVFIDQMNNATDRAGNKLYLAVSIGDPAISCHSDISPFPDENVIVVPSLDDAVAAIHEYEEGNQERRECDGFEITEHKVDTAFLLPEVKVTWSKKKLKIGRCWTYVPWPHTETRQRPYVLYAYVVSAPGVKRSFEKAIRDCIVGSVVATGIITIVTGFSALPAAVAAFATSCQQCLEAKFEANVKCLYPELKLIAEDAPWH